MGSTEWSLQGRDALENGELCESSDLGRRLFVPIAVAVGGSAWIARVVPQFDRTANSELTADLHLDEVCLRLP